MAARQESINTFFHVNVYSPLYSNIIYIMKEAAGVCSAIQGHVSPNETHYYLRTAYSWGIGIIASCTMAPAFLIMFSIQLAISAVIYVLAKIAQNILLIGLGVSDCVSDFVNQQMNSKLRA